MTDHFDRLGSRSPQRIRAFLRNLSGIWQAALQVGQYSPFRSHGPWKDWIWTGQPGGERQAVSTIRDVELDQPAVCGVLQIGRAKSSMATRWRTPLCGSIGMPRRAWLAWLSAARLPRRVDFITHPAGDSR
jgi:hypothetical protein